MSTDEYRYFEAAYKCRSFSEAARKTNISAQGLGKAIKNLEAQLGVKLFSRSSQGIEPTEIADELYGSIRKVIEEEDHIRRIVASSRQRTDVQFLIGRDSRLGDAIRAGVEQYCRANNASIRLLLSRDSEDEHARQLVENNYSYRFLSVELDTLPSLPREPICELHYFPVVNAHNELASKQTISIEDLRGRTVLTESLAHTPMRVLDKMCRERGFGLKLRAVSKTYIWDILSNSTNDITFIRNNEAFEYPWTSDVYAKLTMTPSLDTQIVLQTTLDSIDDELLRCIRKSLAERKFD